MLIRQSADVVLVQCGWVEVLLSFFPFSHRVVSLEGETIQLYQYLTFLPSFPPTQTNKHTSKPASMPTMIKVCFCHIPFI